MEAINLTPHTITLYKEDGTKIEIPSSGTIRLKENTKEIGYPYIVVKSFGDIEVKYNENPVLVEISKEYPYMIMVIVSSIALDALYAAKEYEFPLHEIIEDAAAWIFVAPDTGPDSAVRDENGRIIGIKRFYIKPIN